MKVLALDIATNTGIAVGCPRATPRAWSVDIGKRLTDAQRFSNVLTLTEDLIEHNKPDIVAIEAPIGGKTTSHFLVGLAACVEGQVMKMGVEPYRYHAGSIRKHFVGKALTTRDFPGLSKPAAKKAIKEQVMARCRLLGWPVEDSDQADALALWDYACALRSQSHQITTIGGLFGK